MRLRGGPGGNEGALLRPGSHRGVAGTSQAQSHSRGLPQASWGTWAAQGLVGLHQAHVLACRLAHDEAFLGHQDQGRWPVCTLPSAEHPLPFTTEAGWPQSCRDGAQGAAAVCVRASA